MNIHIVRDAARWNIALFNLVTATKLSTSSNFYGLLHVELMMVL